MVGNISNYDRMDILRAFLKIPEHKSRQDLSDILELGEGTMRSILDVLKHKKLVESSKQGHQFTEEGNIVFDDFNREFQGPEPIGLSLLGGQPQAAVLIKNHELKGSVVRLRDVAVREGAEVALLFDASNDFELPDAGCDFAKEYADDHERVFSQFPVKQGTLIVTSALTQRDAENSALAVALDLQHAKIIRFL